MKDSLLGNYKLPQRARQVQMQRRRSVDVHRPSAEGRLVLQPVDDPAHAIADLRLLVRDRDEPFTRSARLRLPAASRHLTRASGGRLCWQWLLSRCP